ncbi:MAG: Rap1a/Tai family immunity protein [Pseudomonadota bacterium]
MPRLTPRLVKTRTTGLALAATLALASAPAGAVTEDNYMLNTGADLAALCGATTEPSAIHMCQGFLVGAYRMAMAIGAGSEDRLVCIPTDGSVTRDTAARDLAAWIAATPDAQGMKPHVAMVTWARTAYPCE